MNRNCFENSAWKQIQGGQVLERKMHISCAGEPQPLHADWRAQRVHDPWSTFFNGTTVPVPIDKIAAIMQFSFPREFSRKIFPPTVVLLLRLGRAEQANR